MFELLAFISVNFLGIISPGPDFAIVTHYGLKGSRRAALLATLGVTAALFIHVFYSILGVAFFLHESPLIFQLVQVLGACYLGYLGIKMLMPKKNEKEKIIGENLTQKAFMTGFLTNLLNPKATLFILSLFTQFMTPATSLGMKISYGISIPLIAICWYTCLSCLITHRKFLPYLQNYQQKFTKGMGCLLLLLALSVIYSML